MHGGSGDRHHGVVPGWAVAVLLAERLRLRVAEVAVVVAPRVRQVDAADEGDVAGRLVAVPDDHELLVVRPAVAHPHVEQSLRAALLQLLAQGAVLAGEEPDLVPVRAPDQPAHVDTTLVGPCQHLDHGAVGVVGHQQLVGVALPVGEQHQVAVAGRLEAFVQLAEVRRAVDERPREVALGPRAVVVEAGGVVVALGLRQEPVGDVSHGSRP